MCCIVALRCFASRVRGSVAATAGIAANTRRQCIGPCLAIANDALTSWVCVPQLFLVLLSCLPPVVIFCGMAFYVMRHRSTFEATAGVPKQQARWRDRLALYVS